jgi:HPt (histidine-containing phosphotransfer) domain-containing protein
VTSSYDNDPDAPDIPIFDPTRLNTLMQLEDDDEHSTIKAIVEQFLLDVTEQIDRIEHAIASKNFPLVASATHTIKGNAATFGLYQVAQIAKQLEAMAKGSGNEDPAALCKSLREAFAAGKSALTASLAAQ